MIIKSTHWNAFDFFTSIIITVILNKVINELSGFDGYGIYSMAFVVNGSLALFDIGLSNSLIKYISDKTGWEIRHKYISSVLLIYSVIFVFILLLLVIFYRSFDDLFVNYTSYNIGFAIVTLINLAFVLISSVLSGILIANNSWDKLVKGNVAFKIVSFIFTLSVVIFLEADLMYFSFAILVASFTRCVAYYLYVSKYIQIKDIFIYDKNIIIKIIKYIKYSFVNSMSGFVYNQLDKILVAKYLGVVELGYYSFISQIINFIYSFLGVLMKIKFPIMSALHNSHHYETLYEEVFFLFKRTAIFLLLVVITAIFLWKPVMSVYIDLNYANATYYISVLSFLYLFSRLFELNAFYFLSSIANLKWFSYATLALSVVFYFSVSTLIGNYGIAGILLFKITMSLFFYSLIYVFNLRKLKSLFNKKNPLTK